MSWKLSDEKESDTKPYCSATPTVMRVSAIFILLNCKCEKWWAKSRFKFEVEISDYQCIWYFRAFSSQCKTAFWWLDEVGVRQKKSWKCPRRRQNKIRQHCDTQNIDEFEDGANDNFIVIGQFSYKFPEEREKSHWKSLVNQTCWNKLTECNESYLEQLSISRPCSRQLKTPDQLQCRNSFQRKWWQLNPDWVQISISAVTRRAPSVSI